MNTPHIVIIGAGFGGLNVARQLRNAPVQITLIDKQNYHLFQPLLYQVAIAGLLPSQIAYPLRTIFRDQKNITFQLGEVTGINLEARSVCMNGSAIEYDYLVIAVGAETNFFGMDSIQQEGFQVKDIQKAVSTRNHLLRMFEQASREGDAEKRRNMLTFVVVGGGPTGVETAGALAELINHVMIKDFSNLNLNETRVILLEANDHLITPYPHELRHATFVLLRREQVEIMLNTKLANFDGKTVTLGDGRQIATDTLIWTAGIKAAPMLDTLGVERAGAGQVRVARTLQLPQHPEVFALGDAAYFVNGDGQPLPMLSTVAIQQGKVTAQNIQRIINAKRPEPFHYKDPGLLATIGRNAAVARIWGVSFSGFIAWVIWVFLHIYRLIGFRNRILVFVNWAWDYIFYENQIRLITKE
ncbi:MAG TPA: NAD(P)/FAD-dependent oxidoreductase [Anaerolineales bacterium]|nr:NAD(P)/FAD-dependent oxidoreductase [Anaerolineales bacterium]